MYEWCFHCHRWPFTQAIIMITVKIHDNDYKCDYLKNTQTDLVALTFACRHSCDYDYINAVMLLTSACQLS